MIRLVDWATKDTKLHENNMAKLTTAQRNKLPKSDFALGAGRYPINDANHARNALSRVSQNGNSSEKAKVRAAVHRKFPDIGKSKPTYSRLPR